jgi:hypothetical protein
MSVLSFIIKCIFTSYISTAVRGDGAGLIGNNESAENAAPDGRVNTKFEPSPRVFFALFQTA